MHLDEDRPHAIEGHVLASEAAAPGGVGIRVQALDARDGNDPIFDLEDQILDLFCGKVAPGVNANAGKDRIGVVKEDEAAAIAAVQLEGAEENSDRKANHDEGRPCGAVEESRVKPRCAAKTCGVAVFKDV